MTMNLPSFEKVSVLVAGDLMLDRYWSGAASRISPEAPVPVVHVQSTHDRPGGAANVALNLRALGCHVVLLGFLGDDIAAQILRQQLETAGVECAFVTSPDIPTITKLRVLGRHQQLIRLDFETGFQKADHASFLSIYQHYLKEVDVVILSDYGKGSLQQSQTLIEMSQRATKPVFVDPKSNDFSVYQGASVITPNLKEFEAVAGACPDEYSIEEKGKRILKQYDLEALLVTRGEQGMTLLHRQMSSLHLPTRAQEVYDVSGAGDTVISVLAAAFAAGSSLMDAAVLANTAAGIVVGKLGVATASVPEIRRALQRQQGSGLGILTEEELMIAVLDACAHQERIVMTNGCFDILHAGHIAYLEQAKALGDRLILAVNDDDSVRRLKGVNRPINTLLHRMTVLAALRCVDWVVAFSEDTPERLIKRVSPHILVKGGDYHSQTIAGADHVIANGGEVKILAFVPGLSTTQLFENIRGKETCL